MPNMDQVPLQQAINSSLAQSAKPLTFVTITNVNDLADPVRRRQVRRHARATASGRKRLRGNARSITFELPESSVRPPSQISSIDLSLHENEELQDGNPHRAERITQAGGSHGFPSVRILQPIGAGRGLNSLASYPQETNPRMLQLMDFMHSQIDGIHRPLLHIWYTIGVSDKGAFNITLASALFHQNLFLGKKDADGPESTMYYTNSIQSMTQRLQDPRESTSDGVVGTILGLSCYDLSTGKLPRWRVHMDGLRRVLHLRGGIQTIDSNHFLRLMLFWLDVSGSFALDREANYPVPTHLTIGLPTVELSSVLKTALETLNEEHPDLAEMTQIVAALANLTHYLSSDGPQIDYHREEIFFSRTANPVLHRLLSLPRHDDRDLDYEPVAPAVIMHEMLRVSSLMVFGLLRKLCCAGVNGNLEYKEKLMTLLTQYEVDWGTSSVMHLWVFFVAGLVANDDERMWCAGKITEIMRQIGIENWDSLLETVQEFRWVKDLGSAQGDALGGLIDACQRLGDER